MAVSIGPSAELDETATLEDAVDDGAARAGGAKVDQRRQRGGREVEPAFRAPEATVSGNATASALGEAIVASAALGVGGRRASFARVIGMHGYLSVTLLRKSVTHPSRPVNAQGALG